MDLSTIKNFVKQNGDKFILIEGGEPEVVVMSFREYERLTNGSYSSDHRPHVSDHVRDFHPPERRFEETEFIPPSPSARPASPARLEDIRLEDLPL